MALVENMRSCGEGDMGGELPDGSLWLPDLVDMMVQAVENGVTRFELDDELSVAKRSDPNRKRRWLIPLFVTVQVLLKVLVFDKMVADDGCKGDMYGPFDAETVARNRSQVRLGLGLGLES